MSFPTGSHHNSFNPMQQSAQLWVSLYCKQTTSEPPATFHPRCCVTRINSSWHILSISAVVYFFYCVCCLPPPSSVPLPPLQSVSHTPCCVCMTCLCGNPIWWWLRPCHWFRWDICHTHVCQPLLLLGLVKLPWKASPVDFLTGGGSFVCEGTVNSDPATTSRLSRCLLT